MKTASLLPFLFFALFGVVSAQQNECGTDYFHNRMMQEDTAYRNQALFIESQISSVLQSKVNEKSQNAVYVIPIVVHVIHKGEAIGTGTNISDVQIQDAVTGLSNRWRNLIGSGVDTEIEFCLAVRDPSGNPTTGINRVDGSAIAKYSTEGISLGGCSTGAVENTVKALSRWPVNSYYNIWIVSEICNGGWGGWTYFPNAGVNDGATIISSSFKSSSTLPAHEIGHGFYMFHTFEGDGGNVSCPVDITCTTDGDKVCDTPPHKQGDCSTTNPCSGSGIWFDSRYNYMSYCTSLNRFTQGQKDRMRAVAIVNPRLSLLSSLGCITVTDIEGNSSAETFKLFPNPATDELWVIGNDLRVDDGTLTINVVNVLGESVYLEQVSASNSRITIKIDVSSFAKGIYFVQAITKAKSFTKQFVIHSRFLN